MTDHSIERRVFYHHTDTGGVVYYATYLHLLEEGRTEFLLARGLDPAQYMAQGISFPVVHVEADYKAPAVYGDAVRILTRIDRIGRSSIHFSQEILRGETLLVSAKTVWACVGPDFRSRPVPEEVLKKVSAA